ncbi:GNAT family N-acetyltransferase [Fluviicola sp.]|uniref:GNAT family N-acetyltransferase n=1 Tax=Fluviicola sp. TaxID=1917219 RepID=UPI0031D19964
MNEVEIIPYRYKYREQLLNVWEKSVLATHHFLSPADFEAIKLLVKTIDFNELNVFCLLREEEVLGFIGISGRKIEMLFISPEYFGQGLGWKLMNFAIKEQKADKVDVNEQNSQAVAFYQKCGFEVVERTEKDDQGMNYPILRMKLRESL